MTTNRCPGLGVEGHEGHHSYCVQCIEGVPEERANVPSWLDLHAPDPDAWVPDVMQRLGD